MVEDLDCKFTLFNDIIIFFIRGCPLRALKHRLKIISR